MPNGCRRRRKQNFAIPATIPYTLALGGSPRMRAPETWSGRERSSHTGLSAVPRIRLAIFASGVSASDGSVPPLRLLSSPLAFSRPSDPPNGEASPRLLVFPRFLPAEGPQARPGRLPRRCRTPLGRCSETSQALENAEQSALRSGLSPEISAVRRGLTVRSALPRGGGPRETADRARR